MFLLAAEPENIAAIVSLIVGAFLTGGATAYVTIRKAIGEEKRKDTEQNTLTMTSVVGHQNTIIAELRGEITAVNRRLDSRDKELADCHKERTRDRERMARMEERLGIRPDESATHTPLPPEVDV